MSTTPGLNAIVLAAVMAGTSLLGACAQQGTGGDPGARPLPPGASCQSLRSEMDKLIGRGVQPKVEALSAGRKMSPNDRTDAERYNTLLAQYLGARCHM